LEEDGATLKVKEELEGPSRGLTLSFQWASFADHYGITRRGMRPRLNQPVFVKSSLAEMMMAASQRQAAHFKTTGLMATVLLPVTSLTFGYEMTID
jgi:hypothetical protein